jgi:hypothetical protein
MSESELTNRSCPNPICEFDKHHPKANFCILCGTLLFRRCDNCFDVNPRYAKFCQFCGSNLDELREAATGAPPPPEAGPPRAGAPAPEPPAQAPQQEPQQEPEKKDET